MPRQFDSPNRRTVLKSIGAGITVGSFATRATAGSGVQVSGITYDTLTHKLGGPVSGTIERGPGNGVLNGRLDLAGFSIPCDELERRDASESEPYEAFHAADLTDDEFATTVDGETQPLRVRIWEERNHLAGMLSRPTTRFGEIGFLVKERLEIDRGPRGRRGTRIPSGSKSRTRKTPPSRFPTRGSRPTRRWQIFRHYPGG